MRIRDWSSDGCSSDLPEQEGGVEGRRQDQLVGSQDVDRPAPVAVAAQEVRQRQRRLTEEGLGTLLVQGQQATLDRATRSKADAAGGGAQGLRVLRHEGQQRAQVLEG